MVAIGDVFSIVATLVGICVTAWALITGTALLFQNGAYAAKLKYQSSPWKGFFIGLAVTAVFVVAGLVFIAIPMPLAKAFGATILLGLMALATCGLAGISMLIAERIVTLDSTVSRYSALTRAGMIMAIAGVFPFFGWFFVSPILIIGSVGYGLQALIARQSITAIN